MKTVTERPAPADPRQADRSSLEQELLDELTSMSATERGGVFKMWHRSALSLVHLSVLAALEAEGPLPMSRLAEQLDVSDASATGIVDRMERRGLVERQHDTNDRRRVLVHQTAAGTQVFRDIAAHRREMLTCVLAELTPDEMAGLLVGMRAMRSARARVLSQSRACGSTAPPPAG